MSGTSRNSLGDLPLAEEDDVEWRRLDREADADFEYRMRDMAEALQDELDNVLADCDLAGIVIQPQEDVPSSTRDEFIGAVLRKGDSEATTTWEERVNTAFAQKTTELRRAAAELDARETALNEAYDRTLGAAVSAAEKVLFSADIAAAYAEKQRALLELYEETLQGQLVPVPAELADDAGETLKERETRRMLRLAFRRGSVRSSAKYGGVLMTRFLQYETLELRCGTLKRMSHELPADYSRRVYSTLKTALMDTVTGYHFFRVEALKNPDFFDTPQPGAPPPLAATLLPSKRSGRARSIDETAITGRLRSPTRAGNQTKPTTVRVSQVLKARHDLMVMRGKRTLPASTAPPSSPTPACHAPGMPGVSGLQGRSVENEGTGSQASGNPRLADIGPNAKFESVAGVAVGKDWFEGYLESRNVKPTSANRLNEWVKVAEKLSKGTLLPADAAGAGTSSEVMPDARNAAGDLRKVVAVPPAVLVEHAAVWMAHHPDADVRLPVGTLIELFGAEVKFDADVLVPRRTDAASEHDFAKMITARTLAVQRKTIAALDIWLANKLLIDAPAHDSPGRVRYAAAAHRLHKATAGVQSLHGMALDEGGELVYEVAPWELDTQSTGMKPEGSPPKPRRHDHGTSAMLLQSPKSDVRTQGNQGSVLRGPRESKEEAEKRVLDDSKEATRLRLAGVVAGGEEVSRDRREVSPDRRLVGYKDVREVMELQRLMRKVSPVRQRGGRDPHAGDGFQAGKKAAHDQGDAPVWDALSYTPSAKGGGARPHRYPFEPDQSNSFQTPQEQSLSRETHQQQSAVLPPPTYSAAMILPSRTLDASEPVFDRPDRLYASSAMNQPAPPPVKPGLLDVDHSSPYAFDDHLDIHNHMRLAAQASLRAPAHRPPYHTYIGMLQDRMSPPRAEVAKTQDSLSLTPLRPDEKAPPPIRPEGPRNLFWRKPKRATALHKVLTHSVHVVPHLYLLVEAQREKWQPGENDAVEWSFVAPGPGVSGEKAKQDALACIEGTVGVCGVVPSSPVGGATPAQCALLCRYCENAAVFMCLDCDVAGLTGKRPRKRDQLGSEVGCAYCPRCYTDAHRDGDARGHRRMPLPGHACCLCAEEALFDCRACRVKTCRECWDALHEGLEEDDDPAHEKLTLRRGNYLSSAERAEVSPRRPDGTFAGDLTKMWTSRNPQAIRRIERRAEVSSKSLADRHPNSLPRQTTVARIKPLPPVAATAVDPSQVSRLIAVYREHAPSKLHTVVDVLREYHGKEEELFDSLAEKYGPLPAAEPLETSPLLSSDNAAGLEASPI